MKIPLSKLKELCPLDCSIWHIYPAIEFDEITEAIAANNLCDYQIDEKPWDVDLNDNRDYHIGRIAHLVINGWEDPIQLDVGVPSMGCNVDWIIDDGNHRYLAACYLKREYIEAECSGSVYLIEEMFEQWIR